MLILYAHFPWFKMDKRGGNNQKPDKGIIIVWFLITHKEISQC